MSPEAGEASGEAHTSLAGLDGGTEASAEEHVEVGVEDEAGAPVIYLVQAGSEAHVTRAVTPVAGRRIYDLKGVRLS